MVLAPRNRRGGSGEQRMKGREGRERRGEGHAIGMPELRHKGNSGRAHGVVSRELHCKLEDSSFAKGHQRSRI